MSGIIISKILHHMSLMNLLSAPMALANSTLFSTEDRVAQSEHTMASSREADSAEAKENTVNITASALTSPPSMLDPSTPATPNTLVAMAVITSIAVKVTRALKATLKLKGDSRLSFSGLSPFLTRRNLKRT